MFVFFTLNGIISHMNTCLKATAGVPAQKGKGKCLFSSFQKSKILAKNLSSSFELKTHFFFSCASALKLGFSWSLYKKMFVWNISNYFQALASSEGVQKRQDGGHSTVIESGIFPSRCLLYHLLLCFDSSGRRRRKSQVLLNSLWN